MHKTKIWSIHNLSNTKSNELSYTAHKVINHNKQLKRKTEYVMSSDD